jgi:anaerobic selenocysteine-containing dehydrogenase
MKVDRRSFLSFAIGGAAGTALSPLPWKLMDDVSIWSQMWPWVPVPKDGQTTYAGTACTLCPGGCGILVRKIDRRAVKIEGLPGHPVNEGGICMLGLSGLQLLYGPTRVDGPMKRKGARGQGEWQRISWAEAIKEVAGRLNEIRSNEGPAALGCIVGSDKGTVSQLLARLMQAFGSPNFMRTPSIMDSYELTAKLMQGAPSVGFDLENADYIMSFGSGIIDGWGSPVHMFKTNSHWKEGNATVVQVEARLSNSAAKADRWVPVKPGTEAELALGMAHVMVAENRIDSDFIGGYTEGFEDFRSQVLDLYPPASVAQICGIGKDVIVELARNFAAAQRPLAICGRGQGRVAGSLKEFAAIHALNALAGNINQVGGVWGMDDNQTTAWPEVVTDDVAAAGLELARIDGAGSGDYAQAAHLLDRLPKAIEEGQGGTLKALLVAGANPLYSLADTKGVQKAFDGIPFIVSFSSYMDETAANADLILPNHNYLERYEDVPGGPGTIRSVISLARPVVETQRDTRPLGDTIIQIAKSMGGSIADAFDWEDYRACLKDALADRWDTLAEEGYWAGAEPSAPGRDSGFKTPSGKFEFFSAGLKKAFLGDSFQPQGDVNEFPLVLMAVDSMRLASGYIGDPPFMIKAVSDTVLKAKDGFVEINPETAKAIRIADGDSAILSTPKGQATVRVHYQDGIMPGLVAMPRGLGHTAYDKFIAGKGVNVNDLVGPVEDPASGHNAAWGIRAKLAKA